MSTPDVVTSLFDAATTNLQSELVSVGTIGVGIGVVIFAIGFGWRWVKSLIS
ncbi:hypothetical protein ACFOYW_15360 [Gryllotalpicola reticulitermitis]|uniref:Uncharacterized protein n=1 Tax=Gryllotalpicola reticulitermitis TaxID=1184153 RepID=A0ABV8Q8Q4_9MICO